MNPARFTIESHAFEVADIDAPPERFEVRSVPRSYPVRWEDAAPAALVRELVLAAPGNVLVVDRNVQRLHLADLDVPADRVFVVDATEDFKTLTHGVLPLVAFFARREINKASRAIVVGGGITQDVGAFAACMFKRGTPFTLLPTTLLSMCDSCIGAKTGVNHDGAKNQLALFSAPREVVLCPAFLDTLAPREIQSGLGEILKLHVTGGPAALARYEALVPPGTGAKVLPDRLRPLILGALAVKRAVVEEDEFELDLRRSMNYGHTVGHAIESLTDYAIPHGHAVTIGMMVVDALSAARGLLSAGERARLDALGRDILGEASLAALRGVDLRRLTDLLGKDKKAVASKVAFVLVKAIGEMRFVALENDAALAAEIAAAVRAIARGE
jgi:3-dehydroquinate synthase